MSVNHYGAKYIVDTIQSTPDFCLVLLSGGSAIASYSLLANRIRSGEIKNVKIGLVDERYGEPNHPNSNAKAIEAQTGLWSACQQAGIEYRTILQGEPMIKEVKEYEDWLSRAMEACPVRFGVLGIGLDGHTAGILPQPREEFDQLFQTDKLVVGYDSKAKFSQRITLTPHAIRQFTHTLLLAGDGKKQAFDIAANINPDHLHNTPAAIIQHLPEVQVYICVN